MHQPPSPLGLHTSPSVWASRELSTIGDCLSLSFLCANLLLLVHNWCTTDYFRGQKFMTVKAVEGSIFKLKKDLKEAQQ